MVVQIPATNCYPAHMGRRVHLLIEGMYLRADSIAWDAALHYRLLRAQGVEVSIFAERFDPAHYPCVPVQPFGEFEATLREDPGLIIYHWVDGWKEAEALLRRAQAPVALRWHNNTPPWFFAPYSHFPTHKTVRGFEEILRSAVAMPQARFWVNSEFSRRQLTVLGLDPARVDVLQPASPLLDVEAEPAPPGAEASNIEARSPLRLLFVGRIVPHKGHLHVLAAAAALRALSGRPIKVIFPGRADADMPGYPAEIRALASRLAIDLDLPGEISQDDLSRHYRNADVFVGLSEHEGFGLPILEAMAHGLPVVGYRSSAVAEVLNEHPLGVDELDPLTIARRILAAIAPDSRAAIIDWQRQVILPRFSSRMVAQKLGSLVAQAGIDLANPIIDGGPTAPTAAIADAIREALLRADALPAPQSHIMNDLPRDTNPHFVTRYDLRAYRAMLRPGETGDLRSRALKFQFSSHREVFGGVLGFVKRMALRLQDGVVRTIELSHEELEERLQTISDKLDSLADRLERPRENPETFDKQKDLED